MNEQCGWAGKILRVNLTDGTFSDVDTMQYVPKFVGGLGVAHKIWWDEMPSGIKAFDPENKLIFMTGPVTGTASPSSGRAEFVSISPHSYPEQYANTGIGGSLPTYLKWCGYDGIIIEGKSPEPAYLYISADGPELRSAKDIWGLGLVDAQEILHDRHGGNSSSYGIGPAGENLIRFAIIGCGIHSATGQGGHGAVMGSKNLKAITVTKGKHQVKVADPEGLLKTTLKFGPIRKPMPVYDMDLADDQTNPFWDRWTGPDHKPNFSINWMGNVHNKPFKFLSHSCGLGCYASCGFFEFKNVPAVTEPKLIHAMTGCNHTRYEQFFDREDETVPGENFRKGLEIHELAQQLGFGHFDIIYGFVPWLYYTKAMGLDTESKVGMPTEVRSNEWWIKLLKMIAYREGFGDLMAEGIRRTVVELGEDEYAHPIYEGPEAAREDAWFKVRLPLAPLGAWGYTSRSLVMEMPFPMGMPGLLNWLIETRDPHHSKWPDWAHQRFGEWMATEKDYYNSTFPLEWARQSTIRGTLLDSLTACFQFPLRKYMGMEFDYDEVGDGSDTTSMESILFSQVTGVKVTEEEFFESGERINTLFRAIQIRNHERTADMEFNELMPRLYDAYDKDKFKVTTQNWYEYLGWDRETGWPTRETYEKFGLKDVADELAKIDKLPQK